MKRYGFIIISAIIILVLIVAYIIKFRNAPLSDDPSDWGAWGNYVATGISLLSVSLIFITYKEQQESNRIGRFEEHYHIALRTLTELYEKKKDIVDKLYQLVDNHFSTNFDPLRGYEQSKVRTVLRYYYSSAIIDTQEECNEIFRYLHSTLLYIQNDSMLSNKEKAERIMELSCILPEKGRILFLCWGFYRGLDVAKFYDSGLYSTYNLNDDFLISVVRFACTGNRPQKENTNPEDIEVRDFSSEEFSSTYDRLFNNKTK